MSNIDWRFNASVRDIFDANGNAIPREYGRGVYNDSTDQLIGICGKNFKPIQHADILDPILDDFDKRGYDIEERDPSQRDLYDLQGKKGVFVNHRLEHGGALLRTDIISGDFVTVTGNTPWLPSGEDTMLYRTSIVNSHDSSYAAQVANSYERIKCMNGMVDALFSANTRAKHTIGVNIEAFKEKIRRGIEMMGDDAERFEQYATTRITSDQAVEFLKRTIAKLSPKADGTPHFSERLIEQILGGYQREGGDTVFHLWNALTEWSTHGKRKESANATTTTLQREARVATAMRSPEWAGLLEAA